MRRLLLVMGSALVVTTVAMAQTSSDLSGRWVREGSLGPAMDDVAPAWEEISIVDGSVTLRRAPAPADSSTPPALVLPEVYAGDDVERTSLRVAAARQCRSRWEAARFVIECRQTDGGPGGQAPPVLTREVRFVDTDGRLVLELTWQSDERVVTRRAVFRRQQP